MKKWLIALLIIVQVISVDAEEAIEKIEYHMIVEAKSKRIDQYLYRYFWTLGAQCIGYLDSIAFAKDENGKKIRPTNWVIYKTKPLCELEGKSTITDFADAHIVDLEFKDNSIHLLISTTPLIPTGEELRECVIDVKEGEFSELVCGKSKLVVEKK